MHFTSACNLEAVGSLAVAYSEGHVFKGFLVKTLSYLTGGNELAFASCKRAVVYGEGHFKRRFAYLNEFERSGIKGRSYSVADCDVLSAAEAYDVAH